MAWKVGWEWFMLQSEPRVSVLAFLCSVHKIDFHHQAVHCSHTSSLLMCSHYHVHTTVIYWLCKESDTLVAMAHNFLMEANSDSCFSEKTTWQYSFCTHWKIFISVSQKLLHVICANSSDPSVGDDMADLLHGIGYSLLRPQNTFMISGHIGHRTT
jgi:hypothetical protein